MDKSGHDLGIVLYCRISGGSSGSERDDVPRGTNLFLPAGTSGDSDADMVVVAGVVELRGAWCLVLGALKLSASRLCYFRDAGQRQAANKTRHLMPASRTIRGPSM